MGSVSGWSRCLGDWKAPAFLAHMHSGGSAGFQALFPPPAKGGGSLGASSGVGRSGVANMLFLLEAGGC